MPFIWEEDAGPHREGNETHTLQVMKFEKKLKELKHTIEEETLIFQELQDYSDTIILHQC